MKLSILLMLFAIPCSAGDFSEWWHRTPGKNEISNQQFNDQPGILVTCQKENASTVRYLKKWYFYKKHIVGMLAPNQPNQYFIINEQTCQVDTFNSREDFNHTLNKKELIPHIWTRWYDSNWGFFFNGPGNGATFDFFFFRGTWLFFPIVLWSMVMLIKNISKRNSILFLSLAIVSFTIIRIVLDIYPQSL